MISQIIRNEIYLSYHAEQQHSDVLVLKLNKKQKLVEVEYEIEDLFNEHNSNFKICAYYALKEGYKEKTKLFEKGADFGFISVLSEEEFKQILNKFNPLLHE